MSEGSEFGPYTVYECLGEGDTATVHRAARRGAAFRQSVALKRLRSHAAAVPELVRSFVHEARLATRLHHANIVQTYEIGKVGKVCFIAMEYVPGPTLTQVLQQSQQGDRRMPLPIALNILCQICAALDYAHSLCDETGAPLRIAHRDVSPDNILFVGDGGVKLIDFGDRGPDSRPGQVGVRADLFAVGAIAYELLSGRPLGDGHDSSRTVADVHDVRGMLPSTWNPQVTSGLDHVVMTALARDPDMRWQSAAALQLALVNASRDLGGPARNAQLAEWIDRAFAHVPNEQELEDNTLDDTYTHAFAVTETLTHSFSRMMTTIQPNVVDDVVPPPLPFTGQPVDSTPPPAQPSRAVKAALLPARASPPSRSPRLRHPRPAHLSAFAVAPWGASSSASPARPTTTSRRMGSESIEISFTEPMIPVARVRPRSAVLLTSPRLETRASSSVTDVPIRSPRTRLARSSSQPLNFAAEHATTAVTAEVPGDPVPAATPPREAPIGARALVELQRRSRAYRACLVVLIAVVLGAGAAYVSYLWPDLASLFD